MVAASEVNIDEGAAALLSTGQPTQLNADGTVQAVGELYEVPPNLDPVTDQGCGTSARRTLLKFEATYLLQNKWAA